MKPLSNCPYCGCYLESIKQNESWYEKYCRDRCLMKYHQYFDGNFESDKLRYITFETKHFNVYVYFENGFYPNIVHFYSHKEMELHGKAMPVVDNYPSHKIPTYELEAWANSGLDTSTQVREWLDKVDEKLHTLALFS